MSLRAVAAAALLTLSLIARADAQDGAWRDFMPPTRRGATLVHDTARDRYVMFGGADTQLRNDVWMLPGDSTTWRKLEPAGTQPVPRVGAAAVYDELHDRMWMFGGTTGGNFSGTLFGLDAGPEEWVPVNAGTSIGLRAYASLVRDPSRDRLILYGGRTSPLTQAASPEVWVIAPYSDTPQWTRLIPSGFAPRGRWNAIVVYDPPRDRLVVLGGRNQDSVFTDAWQLKFSPFPVWSQIFLVGDQPPARDGAIGVLDPAHDRIVTFGGVDPATEVPNHDVWSFGLGSGFTGWSRDKQQGDVPNELREACATMDVARSRIVVHGGGRPRELIASYATNETRALDVHDVPAWGRILPPGPTPLPRYGTGAAVDPGHDAFWMYGGLTSVDGVTTYSDEFWRGSLSAPGTWRRIESEGPRPGPRHEPSLVYDARTNRALLFGGWNAAVEEPDRYPDDAWSAQLDSPYVWRPVATSGGPSGRRAQATAWDASRRAMFIFGGENAGAVFGDAWELPADGTIAWRLIGVEGGPSPRAWSSAIYDAAGDRMIVFGGSIGGIALDEVWALTLAGTPRWSRLEPSGESPGSRLRHAAVYDPARRRMLVWGGYNSDDQVLTSIPGVWSLSLEDSPTWTKLAPEGIEQPPATSPAFLYDLRRDRILAYGGSALFDDLLPNFNALEFGGGGLPDAWVAGAAAQADGVHLLWQTAASPGTPVAIEKRVDTVGRGLRGPFDPQVGTWFTLASTGVDVDGSVAWLDPLVGAGGAYSYRLVLAGSATGEAAVSVPGSVGFAFESAAPSPTRGPLSLSLQSTGAAPVRVSLFDASGRRVLERDLGILPGGPQVVPFDIPAGRRAGIYFLRVSQGGDAATRKIVIL